MEGKKEDYEQPRTAMFILFHSSFCVSNGGYNVRSKYG